MPRGDPVTLPTLVLDEESTVGLGELCRAAHISAERLMAMVAEGLVEPLGKGPPAEWRFAAVAVTRIRTALRLQRDLEVNLAGAALALDLLDEVRRLRAQVRTLEHRLRCGSD